MDFGPEISQRPWVTQFRATDANNYDLIIPCADISDQSPDSCYTVPERCESTEYKWPTQRKVSTNHLHKHTCLAHDIRGRQRTLASRKGGSAYAASSCSASRLQRSREKITLTKYKNGVSLPRPAQQNERNLGRIQAALTQSVQWASRSHQLRTL